MPIATIVIPAYNKAREIDKVLQALTHQTVPLADFEVIVADHASSDATSTVVQSFEEQLNLSYVYVAREGHGPAVPRNAGVDIASAELIIMLDADVIPCSEFVEAHINAHKDGLLRLIIGEVLGLGLTHEDYMEMGLTAQEQPSTDAYKYLTSTEITPLLRDWRQRWLIEAHDDLMSLPAPWSFAWGGNLSIRKEVFRDVGKFDSEFARNEDIEFGFRVYTSGIPLEFCQRASVLHLPHERNHDFQWRLERKDKEKFLAKHPCPPVEILAADLSNFCCLDVNAWLPVLRTLPPFRGIDRVRDTELKSLSGLILNDKNAPILLLGCGSGPAILPIDAESAAEVDHESFQRARETYRTRTIFNLLGLALPLEDATFEAAVISDLCDVLPAPLLHFVLKEGFRVARRVFIISKRPPTRESQRCVWADSVGSPDPIRVSYIRTLPSMAAPPLTVYEVLTPPTVQQHKWSLRD